MKIYREDSLSNFEFWSGAKDRAEALTEEQFDQIECILEEIEPEEGWSETAINDLFWFEEDQIAAWLGFEDFEALERYNRGEEDDDEEEEDEEEEEEEEE